MNQKTQKKTFQDQFVRLVSRTVDNTVLLLLLVALIFAAYSLWDTHEVYVAADSMRYQTYKPTIDDTKSFNELRAMNPDVMGWLTVYGTKIDYPLVKAQKDNNEYLNKNPEREWEGSGSIFVDHRNSWNFQDFNTVIHGHHMAERKMFGDLELFADNGFFSRHQYANLYYDGQNHGVELYAFLTVDAYDPILQNPGVPDENAKRNILEQIRTKAVHLRNTEVGTGDKIVVLTTCNLTETNGRFTLAGKILDHEVPDPFPAEEPGENTGTGNLDVFRLVNRFLKLPIYLWILILLALIALVWLLYRMELRRLRKKATE